MAVYYKFKSAKDYDSIPIDGHFISVLNLKQKIFEKKHLGRGTDYDLVVTNAQTNEEYLDEAMLVPKSTSVLIRRIPGRPRMPIVTQPIPQHKEPNMEASKLENTQPTNSNLLGAGSSVTKYPKDSEWDEFGSDLYAILEALPVQITHQIQDVPPPSKADEDSRIKALIETPSLDWQNQTVGFGPGRGYVRGMAGRMMAGRGFGRGGFERKTPPPGYVCFRCNQPGHLIQHCPTNGVPEFDVKRVRPPTGIPMSMLMATPDGSYALPSGDVAVLKPNEAAFEKEMEGLSSIRSVGEFPPEFHCPLCKVVMKDAVLTSKCCFTSFCDKCIREHIITKSMCVCGANNVLADDLLPNKTLRDTVNRMMESNTSSTENGGSVSRVQDTGSKMEHPQIEQKLPSPTNSSASKENQALQPQIEELAKVKNAVACQNTTEDWRIGNVPNVCEATRDSISVKECASQGNAPLAADEEQQKQISGDAGKKRKKKKLQVPSNESQWMNPQNFAMENYMMHMGPSAYNPFWNGMQLGMEGFLPPFAGPMPPYMGYGPGALDVPFSLLPQGFPNMMMPPPFPPQRDLAELGIRRERDMNVGPPTMSREEFEARKAYLSRKREIERRGERDMSRNREFSREIMSNGDVSSLRPRSKPLPPPSDNSCQRHRPSPPPCHCSERVSLPLLPCPRSEQVSPSFDRDLPRPSLKRKTSDRDLDYDHRQHHHHRSEPSARSAASEDLLEKSSVFSRISFPTEEKKRKSCSSEVVSLSGQRSNGYHADQKKAVVKGVKRVSVVEPSEDEDEDRLFKRRRPVKYEEERERKRGGSREGWGHRKHGYS